jgi:CheY-specific phosphatase CheX
MIDIQVLFGYFAQAVLAYFEQEVFIALNTSGCQSNCVNSLELFDVSASIDGKTAFDGNVILSMQDELALKLLDVLFDGCDELDFDISQIKQDSIGELLNIFIGKALTQTGCSIEHVTFSSPIFIDTNLISFDTNRNILVQVFESKFGFLKIAYLQ